jgi:hypothetical protein
MIEDMAYQQANDGTTVAMMVENKEFVQLIAKAYSIFEDISYHATNWNDNHPNQEYYASKSLEEVN